MNLLFEQVEKRLKEIEKEIRELEKLPKEEPEGFLRVSVQDRYVRYYHCQKGESTGTYLRRSDEEMAKALAQKEYRKKTLGLLYKEKKKLKEIKQFYTNTAKGKGSFFSGPEELVWHNMSEGRKQLIVPVVPDDDLYRKKWLSQEFKQKPFQEDAPEYFSDKGVRVRSKSELIIAGMLEKAGVPFYYEKPLKLKGAGIIHPDFTVLNVRKRKTMYWEHLGMMDDDDYRERALDRINLYELAGFFPGEELILSHETGIRPLRTRVIERIIQKYLL